MPGIAASEVRIGANGSIYIAPSGTTPPANITAAWTGFTNIGYASEDGLTISREMGTEQIKAWQSISTIRYIVTETDFTAGFTLLQFNKDTLPLYLGGGTVTAQGGGSYKYSISSSPTIDERVLGLEWTDGSITNRLIIPRGMVTESGEMSVGRSEAIGLELTFAAMTPATGTELAYILSNDTAFA